MAFAEASVQTKVCHFSSVWEVLVLPMLGGVMCVSRTERQLFTIRVQGWGGKVVQSGQLFQFCSTVNTLALSSEVLLQSPSLLTLLLDMVLPILNHNGCSYPLKKPSPQSPHVE